MSNGKKTFIRITNQDIYNEIKVIKADLTKFRADNETQHDSITSQHQKNKAEIDLVKYMAGGALSIGLFLSANLILKVL